MKFAQYKLRKKGCSQNGTDMRDLSIIQLDGILMKPCIIKPFRKHACLTYINEDGKRVYAKQAKLSGRKVI